MTKRFKPIFSTREMPLKVFYLFGILLPFVLLAMSTSAFAQAYSSNGSGGGAWSAASTWGGGVSQPPGASNDVTILTGDSVYTAGAVACHSLTIQPGAKLVVSGGALTLQGGNFSIGANAWFYDNYSMKAWPSGAPSYTIDPASNFVLSASGPSTFGSQSVDSTFGNVYVLKSGVTCGANLTIQGNLTVNFNATNSAFRGIGAGIFDSTGMTTLTHHVMGNVYVINSMWSAVDGTNGTYSPLTCIWNIDGNVTVQGSGGAGTSRFGPFTSNDGGIANFGEFNIGGNLSVINGGRLQAANSTSNNSGNTGIINLSGNLTIDTSSVTAANGNGTVFALNFVGSKTQVVSLGKNVTFNPGTSNIGITLFDTVGAKSTVQFTGNKSWSVNCPTAPFGNGAFVVYGKVSFGPSDTLKGTQNFTLKPGATFGTANVSGVDTTAGSIQVTGAKTFPTTVNYVFDGTQAQVTGSAMPATVNDLTINDSAGVTLSKATTITDTLHLVAGVFDNTIPFTLGPNGKISYEGGTLHVAGVKKVDSPVPQNFYVDQNYPNPFNPSTNIQFGVPSKAFVSVKVFNVLGQSVATLLSGERSAGVYMVNFDGANLSSGVYFYRVQVGNSVETKRMMLVK